MAFEQVEVILPNGQRQGPVDWPTAQQWIQQRRIPPDAVLVDTATGQQQVVSSFAAMAGAGGGEGVATLIPYRNMPALVSYYLGLFSLAACIPLLGILGVAMGITAVVLGVMGWVRASQNPAAKGKVHAVIGIVCGAIFGLVGAVVQFGMLGALLSR